MSRLGVLVCALFALLLSACSDQSSLGNYNWPPGASPQSSKIVSDLAKAGIQVIQLGSIVEIVLPADLIFEPRETHLLRSAEPLLNQIASILNRYCNTQVKAIGHTDIIGTNQQQIDFSKLQAQAVVTYLWSHGVALKRMSFIGVGIHDDDATFHSAFGNGYNRRVELIFWRTNNGAVCNQ